MSAVARSELQVAPPVGGGGLVPRPELVERLLRRPRRLALLSAPAGSGKTVLLRSWLAETPVTDGIAWVPTRRDEHDPRRFWLSILDALRETCVGAALVRAMPAAHELDAREIVERLLEALGSLDGRLWLVIDDLHELRSDEALRQLETLVMRAPAELRFLLATRHDPRLGLHRLRLEGELTEIRAGDLRFTLDQTRQLLDAADVELSPPALAVLHERTEGWAAGIRLAVQSLIGQPDPDRAGAAFSGGERTVAEYLLAEVLERQPPEVRRVLLRTSVLERFNGALANHLTGDHDGDRILHELEAANAFVVSLDGAGSWFRCHRLFADLLALELRRTEPGELSAIHRAAAVWFAEHDHPLEGIRHAQAAEEWSLAADMLSDHGLGAVLNGEAATIYELLNRFPAGVTTRSPELIALAGVCELSRGSLGEAEWHLAQAIHASCPGPGEGCQHAQLTLSILRLGLARQRGDVSAVAEEAQRLLAPVGTTTMAEVTMSEELRALALISRGIAQTWSSPSPEAEHDLDRGIALVRHLERPYLELMGHAHGAQTAVARSSQLAVSRSRRAIELAEGHGWSDAPVAGVAYAQLAGAVLVQGQLDEAEQWLQRAERTLSTNLEPAAAISLCRVRGELELARGRPAQALEAFHAVEPLAGQLLTPHVDAELIAARTLQTRVRLDDHAVVEAALADMDEPLRCGTCMRNVVATLRLAEADPAAAADCISPTVEDSVTAAHPARLLEALLLGASARYALGDAGAAHRALERALDLAAADGVLLPFLLHPAGQLLESHFRGRTDHASLVGRVLAQLAGRSTGLSLGDSELYEQLSTSERRVLRYLPTNLSLREIADELYVSVQTIKSHTKHIYSKLNVHGRAEAVERARELGLLAPSLRLRGAGQVHAPARRAASAVSHSPRGDGQRVVRHSMFAAAP